MKFRIAVLSILGFIGMASFAHVALTSNDAIPVGPSWEVSSLSSGEKIVTLSDDDSGFDILLAGDTVLTQSQKDYGLKESTLAFPFVYFNNGAREEGTMSMRWHSDLDRCGLNPMTGRMDNVSGTRDIGGVAFTYTSYYGSQFQPERSFQYSVVRDDICYQFVGTIKSTDTALLDDVLDLVRFFDVSESGERTYLAPEVSLRLPVGSIVKCEYETKVYELVSATEAKWLKNEAVYLALGHDWNEIQTVACNVDTAFPDEYTISAYDFPTDKLVKFAGRPEVYAVETDCSPETYCNDVLTHIANEAAAIAHYGANWPSLIVELPYYTLDNFLMTGEEITAR